MPDPSWLFWLSQGSSPLLEIPGCGVYPLGDGKCTKLSPPPCKGLSAPGMVLPAHNHNSTMEVKGFCFYFFILHRH